MKCTTCSKTLFQGDYVYGMCHECVQNEATEKAKGLAKTWESPSLVNMARVDEIPDDLLERLLKL